MRKKDVHFTQQIYKGGVGGEYYSEETGKSRPPKKLGVSSCSRRIVATQVAVP